MSAPYRDTLPSRHYGTVRVWNDPKGFGFIIRETLGPDVFVHASAIRGEGRRSLRLGQRVEFSLVSDPRGEKAADVVGA